MLQLQGVSQLVRRAELLIRIKHWDVSKINDKIIMSHGIVRGKGPEYTKYTATYTSNTYNIILEFVLLTSDPALSV